MKKMTFVFAIAAGAIILSASCKRPRDANPQTAPKTVVPDKEQAPAPDASRQSAAPTEMPVLEKTLTTDDGIVTATLSTKGSSSTLSLRPAATDGQDAMILSYDPDPNYAGLNRGQEIDLPALVWTAKGIPTYRRSLIRFTQLSFIPAGAKILSAQFTLYGLPFDSSPNCKQGNSSGSKFQNNDLYLQMATSAWDENSVTWATQPSTTQANRLSIGLTSNQWNENKTIGIEVFVQNWVNGAPNHGMMLMLQSESPLRSITFGSSENEEAYRPKLVVVYQNMNTQKNPK